MNTKKLIISGVAALAMAVAASRAQASILPGSAPSSNNSGDLILGFQNSTQTSDVVFDIGQFTSYEGVAPGTYTVGGFSATDLTTAFGTNGTNGAYGSATAWTVFGSTGNANALSKPDGTLWAATTGAQLNPVSYTSQNSLSVAIDGFVSSAIYPLGGTGGDTAVLNPKAFTNLAPDSGFGLYPIGVESAAAGTTVMQLWQLVPGAGAGTDLGYFTLNASAGTFTFTAIPEPSIYAALLGVVTLGIVAIRRRKQSQLAV